MQNFQYRTLHSSNEQVPLRLAGKLPGKKFSGIVENSQRESDESEEEQQQEIDQDDDRNSILKFLNEMMIFSPIWANKNQ